MLIMETPSVCTTLAPVWQIIGWVLWVFKIVIPIVIIIFGVIDLGKAVVASKDDYESCSWYCDLLYSNFIRSNI